MLLRLFKTYQTFVLILIPLTGILLWLKTFITPSFTEFPFDSYQMPFYELITHIISYSNLPLLPVIIAFILLLSQAFILIQLNVKYIFIEGRTYLPSIIFILISCSYVQLQRLHPVLFANLFFLLAINKIFGSYTKEDSDMGVSHYKKESFLSKYFDAAFLLSIGSLFYANMLFYMLIIWIGILILRQFNWREWLMTFLGFLIPYVLIMSYYYFTDNFSEFLKVIYGLCAGLTTFSNGEQAMVFISNMSIPYYMFYSFLILLVIMSIFYFFIKYYRKRKSVRKYFKLFLWLLLLSIAIFFFVDSASIELLIILSIPVSYIISNYFVSMRSKLWGEILFTLLVGLLIYTQIE